MLQSSDAQADIFRQERNRRIYICMQALPEQHRAVFQLKYFDGYNFRELSNIPLTGDLSYNNDLSCLRAVLIDDYLYLFWDEFKVVKIS